jgi:hypothetical protein
MTQRYGKTDVGRGEIRARAHAMTRTARNLLLIIDPSKDGDEWVRLVQGATPADLQTLLDAGLVAPIGGVAPKAAVAATSTATVPAPAVAPAAAPTESLTYSELYDLLPALAKEHLGLMKGYRFALSIEKATGLAGLQQVALDLAAEVERVKGPGVARSVKRALMLP